MDQDQTYEEGTLTGSRWVLREGKGHVDSSSFGKGLSCRSRSAPTRLQVKRVAGKRGHEEEAEAAGRGPDSPPPPIGRAAAGGIVQVPRAASTRAPQGVKGCCAPQDVPKLAGRGVSFPASRRLSARQVSAQLVVLLSVFSYSVMESQYLELIFLFMS